MEWERNNEHFFRGANNSFCCIRLSDFVDFYTLQKASRMQTHCECVASLVPHASANFLFYVRAKSRQVVSWSRLQVRAGWRSLVAATRGHTMRCARAVERWWAPGPRCTGAWCHHRCCRHRRRPPPSAPPSVWRSHRSKSERRWRHETAATRPEGAHRCIWTTAPGSGSDCLCCNRSGSAATQWWEATWAAASPAPGSEATQPTPTVERPRSCGSPCSASTCASALRSVATVSCRFGPRGGESWTWSERGTASQSLRFSGKFIVFKEKLSFDVRPQSRKVRWVDLKCMTKELTMWMKSRGVVRLRSHPSLPKMRGSILSTSATVRPHSLSSTNSEVAGITCQTEIQIRHNCCYFITCAMSLIPLLVIVAEPGETVPHLLHRSWRPGRNRWCRHSADTSGAPAKRRLIPSILSSNKRIIPENDRYRTGCNGKHPGSPGIRKPCWETKKENNTTCTSFQMRSEEHKGVFSMSSLKFARVINNSCERWTDKRWKQLFVRNTWCYDCSFSPPPLLFRQFVQWRCWYRLPSRNEEICPEWQRWASVFPDRKRSDASDSPSTARCRLAALGSPPHPVTQKRLVLVRGETRFHLSVLNMTSAVLELLDTVFTNSKLCSGMCVLLNDNNSCSRVHRFHCCAAHCAGRDGHSWSLVTNVTTKLTKFQAATDAQICENKLVVATILPHNQFGALCRWYLVDRLFVDDWCPLPSLSLKGLPQHLKQLNPLVPRGSQLLHGRNTSSSPHTLAKIPETADLVKWGGVCIVLQVWEYPAVQQSPKQWLVDIALYS